MSKFALHSQQATIYVVCIYVSVIFLLLTLSPVQNVIKDTRNIHYVGPE